MTSKFKNKAFSLWKNSILVLLSVTIILIVIRAPINCLICLLIGFLLGNLIYRNSK